MNEQIKEGKKTGRKGSCLKIIKTQYKHKVKAVNNAPPSVHRLWFKLDKGIMHPKNQRPQGSNIL